MNMIILAFPAGRYKTADRIGKLLGKNGFAEVIHVETGSEAIRKMSRLDGGILICPEKLSDMDFTELLKNIPPHFEMLLLCSGTGDAGSDRHGADWSDEAVITLRLPVRVREFIEVVQMMDSASVSRRTMRFEQETGSRRDPRDENYIRNAKDLLMQKSHVSEEEAHRYLQKTSMDTGRSLAESAKMLLLMEIMH